ncbi:MAG: hypothetical protein ABSG59_22465 [Verrucomicrobiota bacterium]
MSFHILDDDQFELLAVCLAHLVLIGFLPIYAQQKDCVTAVVFCDFGDGRIPVLAEKT